MFKMSRLISFSRLAVAATRCRRSLPNVVSQRFMATTLSHTPLNFQEFEAHRENRDATIIDVRQPEELLTDGQIPLSTNIPMGELEKALQMSAEEFEETYRIPKPHPSDPVIFFCKGGVRASEANDFARWLFQYNNTAFYSGIIDWKAQTRGTQKIKFDPSSAPLNFKQFEIYRKDGNVIIIDVREPDELVNEGVIPGATNIPMGQVESALRMSPAEFEATYGRPQPQREDPIIFICRVGRRAAEMGNHVRQVLLYTNTTVYPGLLDWKANASE